MDAWKEEIFCDFIGVLTFGPSFISALCELLYAVTPSGVRINARHPPVGLRINLMLQVARLRGFDSHKGLKGSDFVGSFKKFWSGLQGKRKPEPWFDIFSDYEVNLVVDKLSEFLRKNEPALYNRPEPKILKKLFELLVNRTPPVGSRISKDGTPSAVNIDFRDTLYAGWLASNHQSSIPFSDINRLCEHGIMQQLGINKFFSYGE